LIQAWTDPAGITVSCGREQCTNPPAVSANQKQLRLAEQVRALDQKALPNIRRQPRWRGNLGECPEKLHLYHGQQRRHSRDGNPVFKNGGRIVIGQVVKLEGVAAAVNSLRSLTTPLCFRPDDELADAPLTSLEQALTGRRRRWIQLRVMFAR